MNDTSRYQHSSSCFVYQSTTLNYGSGLHVATYDSLVWNDNGCFDFGSNRWKATKAGRIMVSAGINASFANSTVESSFFTFDTRLFGADGNLKSSARLYQNNQSLRTFYQITGTAVYEVDIGDQLETFFQNGHTSMDRNGVDRACYMSVFYLI